MPKNTRERAEIAKRRRDVEQKYRAGMDQAEIAIELGISQTTISRDVNYLIKSWEEEQSEDIKAMRNEQAAGLDYLEQEAADNYFRLKKIIESNQDPFFYDSALWKNTQRNFVNWLKVKETKIHLFGLALPVKLEVSEGTKPKHKLMIYKFPENDRNKEFLETLEKQKQEKQK